MVQQAPKSPPRRPKMPSTKLPTTNRPKAAKIVPRWPKRPPREPQTAQQGSESVQEGPKMSVNCFKTAAEAPKKGEDIQERRLFKHGTDLERVVNSTSFPLCCCAGTVAGIAAGS